MKLHVCETQSPPGSSDANQMHVGQAVSFPWLANKTERNWHRQFTISGQLLHMGLNTNNPGWQIKTKPGASRTDHKQNCHGNSYKYCTAT